MRGRSLLPARAFPIRAPQSRAVRAALALEAAGIVAFRLPAGVELP